MPIQIEHLTHTYMPGSPFSAVALRDISLTIEDGELIGLLGRLLGAFAHGIQLVVHPQQGGLSVQHLLLHFLVGLAGRIYAVLFHGGQRLLALLDHGILRGDLLLQQLAFLLHVGLFVPGSLQLLFVQLQGSVQRFHALLRLVHPALKLRYPGYAHFYTCVGQFSSPRLMPCI